VASGRETLINSLIINDISFYKKNLIGETPCFTAIRFGYINIIKKLITKKLCSLDSQNDLEENLLLYSLRHKIFWLFDYYKKQDLDYDVSNSSGHGVIYYLIKYFSQDQAISYMKSLEISKNYLDKNNNSILHIATLLKKNKVLKKSLQFYEKKEISNHLNKNQQTALHQAVFSQNIKAIKILTMLNVDMDIRDSQGKTALFLATEFNNIEFAFKLLLKKANTNITDDEGHSCLHWSLQHRSLNMAKILYKYGAKIDSKDSKGHSFLIRSIEENQLVFVRWIISLPEGKNLIYQADLKGATPLIWGAAKGNLYIVRLLLNNGGNINGIANDGNSVLLWAVSKGNLRVVKYLLSSEKNKKKKVDINHHNKKGDTALLIASHLGFKRIVSLLLEYNPNSSIVNEDGLDAYTTAKMRNHNTIANMLRYYNMKKSRQRIK